MVITKDQLLEQRQSLLKQKARHVADAYACNGALEIVNDLLAKLDAEESAQGEPKAAS